MGLNRDKFRKIVGGITTAPPESEPAEPIGEPMADAAAENMPETAPAQQQGRGEASEPANLQTPLEDRSRFAKRGRPKGRKEEEPAAKGRKVKVSLFLSEILINDLYNWAHEDRIHPGEMFERALKPFHEREAKRRQAEKP